MERGGGVHDPRFSPLLTTCLVPHLLRKERTQTCHRERDESNGTASMSGRGLAFALVKKALRRRGGKKKKKKKKKKKPGRKSCWKVRKQVRPRESRASGRVSRGGKGRRSGNVQKKIKGSGNWERERSCIKLTRKSTLSTNGKACPGEVEAHLARSRCKGREKGGVHCMGGGRGEGSGRWRKIAICNAHQRRVSY